MYRLFHLSTRTRRTMMVCPRRFPTPATLTRFDPYRLGLSTHGPQLRCKYAVGLDGCTLTTTGAPDSLHRVVPAMASLSCQAFRELVEVQVRLQRDDPILGLDSRYAPTDLVRMPRILIYSVQDSSDTENSTMFDDDKMSGLGRWGDPNDDIQITTGGFRDLVRVYPSPHRIRRSYTPRPLANIPNPFPNDPLAPSVDTSVLINGSFTRANYNFLLNGFTGDLRSFQAYLEGPQVRGRLVAIIRPLRCPHLVRRAPTVVLIL